MRGLPAREVLLPASKAYRDEPGAERRGHALGIGQELDQALLRAIDAVLPQRREELIANVRRAPGARFRVVGEGGADDPGEGLAQRRARAAGILEVAGHQSPEGGGGVRGVEGKPSGAEPVEDGPQGEDVGPLVRLASLDDLGRHVVGRADQRSRHRHPVVLGQDPGDPEVGQLHRGALPDLVDHDVLGLQVPVDDAGRVGVDERVGQRHAHERAALRQRDAHLVGEGAKGPAPHELGDEPALVGGVAGVVEDLHDPRMGEPGHRACLPGEASPGLGLGREVGVQDLDRDLAIERGVATTIDDRHSTGSYLLEELVAVDPANQGTPLEMRHLDPMSPGAL